MTQSYITNWLPKEDAQAKVKALIADGTYQKGQIKLSSYRWADLKDHSKGYVARVHVVTGIHPELELGLTGKRKKSEKTEAKQVEEVPTEEVEFIKTKVQFHGCRSETGELIQVVEIESDMTSEQIELLQNEPEGQGQEIAISLAEDFHIEEFNYYVLVA
jgi:hypothetical protein